MKSVLITGSNRGIGLEWVRQYAADGWRVFATCRHPAEADDLREIKRNNSNVTIHRCDVTLREDVRALVWELENDRIDVLISNAGVYLEKGAPEFGCLRYEEWVRTLQVNTLGSVRIIEALVNNVALSDKKLIAVVSSHMGSIADINSAGNYYYRSSKAALNAVMQGLSWELKPMGVGVLILHPGGVKTRMGPRDGIPAEESVRGMRGIIDRFTMADSGRFVRYDNVEMPW